MNIIFRQNVKRTYITNLVISKLEPIFLQQECFAEISSVLRTPNDQLYLIEQEAKKRGILTKDSSLNFSQQIEFEGVFIPRWQWVWSKLLNANYIINPPEKAICLLDYYRNGKENMKGKEIDYSQHFTGLCFDITPKKDSKTTLDLIQTTVKLAMKQDKNIGITYLKLEPKQNCLHIECERVDL